MGAVNPTVIQNQPAFHPDQRTNGDIFLQGLQSLGQLAVAGAGIQDAIDKNDIEQQKADNTFAYYLSQADSEAERRGMIQATGRNPDDPQWSYAKGPWNLKESQDAYWQRSGDEFAAQQRAGQAGQPGAAPQQTPAAAGPAPAGAAAQSGAPAQPAPSAAQSPTAAFPSSPPPEGAFQGLPPAQNRVAPEGAFPSIPVKANTPQNEELGKVLLLKPQQDAQRAQAAQDVRALAMEAPQAQAPPSVGQDVGQTVGRTLQMALPPGAQPPAQPDPRAAAQQAQEQAMATPQKWDPKTYHGKLDPATGQPLYMKPEAVQEFHQQVVPAADQKAAVANEAWQQYQRQLGFLDRMMGAAIYGDQHAIAFMQNMPEEYRVALAFGDQEMLARLRTWAESKGLHDMRLVDAKALRGAEAEALDRVDRQRWLADPANNDKTYQTPADAAALIAHWKSVEDKLSPGTIMAVRAGAWKVASEYSAMGLNTANAFNASTAGQVNRTQAELYHEQARTLKAKFPFLARREEAEIGQMIAQGHNAEAQAGLANAEAEWTDDKASAYIRANDAQAAASKTGAYANLVQALGQANAEDKVRFQQLTALYQANSSELRSLYAQRQNAIQEVAKFGKGRELGQGKPDAEAVRQAQQSVAFFDERIKSMEGQQQALLQQINTLSSKANGPEFSGINDIIASMYGDKTLGIAPPSSDAAFQYNASQILDSVIYPDANTNAMIQSSGQDFIDPTDARNIAYAMFEALRKGDFGPQDLRSYGPEDQKVLVSGLKGTVPFDDAWLTQHSLHLRNLQAQVATGFERNRAFMDRYPDNGSSTPPPPPPEGNTDSGNGAPPADDNKKTPPKGGPPTAGPGAPGVTKPVPFQPTTNHFRMVRMLMADPSNVQFGVDKNGRFAIKGPYAGYSSMVREMVKNGYAEVRDGQIAWRQGPAFTKAWNAYQAQDKGWTPPVLGQKPTPQPSQEEARFAREKQEAEAKAAADKAQQEKQAQALQQTRDALKKAEARYAELERQIAELDRQISSLPLADPARAAISAKLHPLITEKKKLDDELFRLRRTAAGDLTPSRPPGYYGPANAVTPTSYQYGR